MSLAATGGSGSVASAAHTHGLPRSLVLALALLAVGLAGCDSWFYYPSDRLRSVDLAGLHCEVARIEPAPGSRATAPLSGRFLAAAGESRGTIVYCYGYDKNLTHHLEGVRWLARAGFDLLVFDYRGYGQSPGRPSRSNTVEDAVAAIDYALDRDPHRTIVYGHSLGGAIGVVAAARRPAVRALIAESTFTTYRDAASARVPFLAWLVPLLVSRGLDPIDAIPQLAPRPVLILHGAADRAVPAELGRRLFDHARPPRELLLIEGGTHASPWGRSKDRYRARIVAFCEAAIARPAGDRQSPGH